MWQNRHSYPVILIISTCHEKSLLSICYYVHNVYLMWHQDTFNFHIASPKPETATNGYWRGFCQIYWRGFCQIFSTQNGNQCKMWLVKQNLNEILLFIHLNLRRFGSLRPQLFIAKNVTYCGIASHTQSTSWINMGVCFAWCVSFSFRVCALLRSLHRFAAASWWDVCLFQHWY